MVGGSICGIQVNIIFLYGTKKTTEILEQKQQIFQYFPRVFFSYNNLIFDKYLKELNLEKEVSCFNAFFVLFTNTMTI